VFTLALVYGNTALIFSASECNESVSMMLVDSGADVNAEDKNGNTALMFSASGGRESMGLRLLEQGADVNAKNTVCLCVIAREEGVVRVEQPEYFLGDK